MRFLRGFGIGFGDGDALDDTLFGAGELKGLDLLAEETEGVTGTAL